MEQVYKISEEDLLQIGRTAIYEALDKFTPGKGKAFSSYAYMVANSELIMFIRKLQRGKRDPRKVTSLNEKLDENGEYEMYFPSPVNIEKYVLNKIELEESLKQINDYQRKVILLRWQGYTYEEISGMTGKTINAVNKTYLKAIGKMRKGA
jgi:RNA polymerase sigma factor (sigma-70 family)